jgi:protein PhnA
MTETLQNCPKCNCQYVYEDGNSLVCPECGNEWPKFSNFAENSEIDELTVKDASGNILKDGDTITVIKDLKIKGSSSVVKVGTKVKNIRIVSGDHDIDCKIPGIGAMGLKSEFVRKVNE